MFIIYNLIGIIITLFSPFIFIYRIVIGKEDINRFTERYCKYNKTNIFSKTIWIHVASVGELMSIVPVLKKLEQNKKIKQILLTSTTTSSANIFLKLKLKKTTHKYFPIDTNFFSQKFIKYWNPSLAIFVESEIWPNMLKNLHAKNIPIILLNARITKKTYKKWMMLKNFAQNIFSKIDLALPQNKETFKYLKYLGVKNIKFSGNLKYYGVKTKKIKQTILDKKFKNYKVWCAASTHFNEELTIGNLHKQLKKKTKNLLTVIIPRHVKRSKKIIYELEKIGLKTETHSSNKKIKKDTDIYLVDSFGDNKNFYQLSNLTFMGGSLIQHGGQNPLEPARQGNFIIHGPHVKNFEEVYAYLKKLKITSLFNNSANIKNLVRKKLNKKISNSIVKKIDILGNVILKKNLSQLNNFIK